MHHRSASLAFLCLLAAGTAQAQDPPQPGAQQQDQVIRPDPSAQTRLAVTDFVARTSANRATEQASKTFNKVLWDDLGFSAVFEMPSKSFYPLRPLRTPGDVTFENWQVPTLDVDFLAFGNLQADSTRVVVEAYLYDVKTRRQVLGKRYTVPDTTQIRQVAHAFSDEVVFRLSGGASRGVAQTQIAFASRRGGSKEIFVADYDGDNIRTITANGGINKFPGWSSDNKLLAFVTNLPSSTRWELWIQDLAGSSGRRVISVPTSYVSSPAFSSEGSRIAYSARAAGKADSDIHTASLGGGNVRNLTNHPAIDTAPTWSPTGQQIAFISDRSGTPQLWLMEADGTNVRRLVNEGGHCDSPDWSPDGRFIAYSWQAPRQFRHDIFRVEVATGEIRQLTSGRGSKENPHWSPDSRHIVFQTTRTGSKQIAIMNADGNNLKQITSSGINESPAWSGYRSIGGNQ